MTAPDRSVFVTASEWALAEEEGAMSAADQAERDAWLAASPAHRTAFAAAKQALGDIDAMPELADIPTPLAPEPPVRPPSPSRPRFAPSRQTAGLLAACALVVISAVAVLTLRPSPVRDAPLATAIAEVRAQTLPDGSTVTLGARTRASYRFDDGARRVALTEGEAFFSVVSDGRPFIVTVADTTIEVMGTKFDVRRGAEQVEVSVLEGVVAVTRTVPARPGAAPETSRVVLQAGDRVLARDGLRAEPVEEAAADLTGAWRTGRLVYVNARLLEVVADARRYYDSEIVFASPDLHDLRVTTSFNADDVDAILHMLDNALPVSVTRSTDGRRVVIAPDTDTADADRTPR